MQDQGWQYLMPNTSTTSGEIITPKLSLNQDVFYRCLMIRANTIAKMPIHVFRQSGAYKEKIVNDISYLLNKRPNPNMTPFKLKQCLSINVDLFGNGYIWIETKKGRPINLWVLDSGSTRLEKVNNKLFVVTKIENKEYRKAYENCIVVSDLALDGLNGKSKLDVAMETLGNMKASTKLLGYYYKSGTLSKVAIQSPQELSDTVKKKIKQSWREINGGIENSDVAIFDAGFEVKDLKMSFADAQFQQLSKLNKETIATIMGVPLHMINSMERATFNNIQQTSLDFITNTIQPILTEWEEEIDYKIFNDDERMTDFIKFNMSVALRADDESRAKFYKDMDELGAYSINDIREKEDMNPIEGGDVYRVSLNYVDVKIADKYQLAKANADLKGGEGDNQEELL